MLVPVRADLVYELLPVGWRTIKPYGVELHGLRYDGPGVSPYRNRISEITGPQAGKWPIRFDPRRHPARVLPGPRQPRVAHALVGASQRGRGAVQCRDARLRAPARVQTDRFPDDRRALGELLERWDADLTRNPTERRMALRLARQRQNQLHAAGDPQSATVTDLASVRAVAKRTGAVEVDEPSPTAELLGDDDDSAELDAVAGDELDDGYFGEAFGSFS